MRQFKKRTIVLILASVITVTVGFCDTFKNSLMGIEFEPAGDNAINMVLSTKTAYSGNITPAKRDANTYVLMLPETNSLAQTPDLSKVPEVSDVNIRTMGYSDSAKGYTKITVRTVSPISLMAKNTLYIAPPDGRSDARAISRRRNYIEDGRISTAEETMPKSVQTPVRSNSIQDSQYSDRRQNYQNMADNEEEVSSRHNESLANEVNKSAAVSDPAEKSSSVVSPEDSLPPEDKSSDEATMVLLGMLLIAAVSAFLYVKAKNKMIEIAGESVDLDLKDSDEEQGKNKTKKSKSIAGTVQRLDKKYSSPVKMPVVSEYTPSEPAPVMSSEKSTDDMNIVDLDELFREQQESKTSSSDNEENNDALDDFLSSFEFEGDEAETYTEAETEAEVEGKDENAKVGELEIVPQEILSEGENAESEFDEDFYEKIINNDKLSFTESDIGCINQILNIEINDDTLRNAEKYAVSVPIIKPKSKILEELVSDYAISRDITFTEEDIGIIRKLMEVEIDNDFVTDLRTDPERTKEMERQIREFHSDESKRHSEVITLKVADLLPDLGDVVANPEKYQNNKIRNTADPDELLKSIENVSMKPFYDGSRTYDVVNHFDSELEENIIEITVSGPKETVINQIEQVTENTDSDKIKLQEVITPAEKASEHKPEGRLPKARIVAPAAKTEANAITKAKENNESINKPVTQVQKINKESGVLNSAQVRKDVSPAVTPKIEQAAPAGHVSSERSSLRCIVDGKSYNILSSVEFTDKAGCHLAKNDEGYVVLSYYRYKLTVIKQYKGLKSEKIQARLSEKLANGVSRYIIRIGTVKFIADYADGCVKYVMDL